MTSRLNQYETNIDAVRSGDGAENVSYDYSRQASSSGRRHNLCQLHVALPDLTYVTLEIDRETTATEIMDQLIDLLRLERSAHEARHILSLWLVSPNLELQLKPNHCPMTLFKKWPVYLRKYTSLDEKSISTQHPTVHLRRNVFASRYDDLKVKDAEILEMLFTEARFNVISGSYPCDKEVVLKLAGILLVMQYGEYDEARHTPDFFKSLHSLVPVHLQNRKHIYDELCGVLSFYHKSASQSLDAKSKNNYDIDSWFYKVFRTYITEVHSLPYYGSVFFTGFIERAHKSFLKNTWLPVTIAVNTDGIFLIDSENKDPILGVLYNNLSWEFIDVSENNTESSTHESESHESTGFGRKKFSQKVKSLKDSHHMTLPSLLLQYPEPGSSPSATVKRLVVRVFTKAARLIDAFIENCSDTMKEMSYASPEMIYAENAPSLGASSNADAVDSRMSTAVSRKESLAASMKCMVKQNRLVCQAFTQDGCCVDPEG